MSRNAITVAITGASGAAYGLRLLECLLSAGKQVYLMVSAPGQMVISLETGLKLPSKPSDMAALLSRHFAVPSGQLEVFGKEDWMAPVASGSNAPAAMVVCPCSAGTLAAIAAGVSNKLIERAADVMLKEQRKLILVPREMPFSVIHLENMLRLARAGAVILPANPGFYHQPTHIADLVDFVVARILDHLNVEHNLATRWGNTEPVPDE